MKYLLDFNGVSEVTDEFYASIPSSAFTEKLDELKEGKTLVMSDDQIKFYNLGQYSIIFQLTLLLFSKILFQNLFSFFFPPS